jgi:glutathione S-transferase
MKLFHTPASPFARKVRACAISRGIDRQIELVGVNPWNASADLLAANPLSKVPCLVTADGVALFDSPVICEFLDSIDSLAGALPLFPRSGGARWRALKFQALADGIMDAAVIRRRELGRPREVARDENIARQKMLVEGAVDLLERDLPHQTLDIGSIAVACALGYLDFRWAVNPWRPGHPLLAAWYAEFAENPGIAGTVPSEMA